VEHRVNQALVLGDQRLKRRIVEGNLEGRPPPDQVDDNLGENYQQDATNLADKVAGRRGTREDDFHNLGALVRRNLLCGNRGVGDQDDVDHGDQNPEGNGLREISGSGLLSNMLLQDGRTSHEALLVRGELGLLIVARLLVLTQKVLRLGLEATRHAATAVVIGADLLRRFVQLKVTRQVILLHRGLGSRDRGDLGVEIVGLLFQIGLAQGL